MAKAKKLPSGNWRVNLYVGKDTDGKRKYKSFTSSDKKQAEFLAAEYRINLLGQSTQSMLESVYQHIFREEQKRITSQMNDCFTKLCYNSNNLITHNKFVKQTHEI